MKIRKKNDISAYCKISIIPRKLVCRPNDELKLVVRNEFVILTTNLKSDDKRLGVVVVKVYLTRWRIEEFYRFKKQQFGFENVRVYLMKSRNFGLLLTISIRYIGFISEKK